MEIFLCTDDNDYIEFRNQIETKNWQIASLKKSLNKRKTDCFASLRVDSKIKQTAKKLMLSLMLTKEAVEDFINKYQPAYSLWPHT